MLNKNNFGRRAFAINLTQHAWAQAQINELEDKGYEVVTFDVETQNEVKGLLTFDNLPTREEMVDRAERLAEIAERYFSRNSEGYVKNDVALAMVGGAPWFMSVLESRLKEKRVMPIYAFSQRVSEEVTLPDGTVEKRNIFRHEGFIFPQG